MTLSKAQIQQFKIDGYLLLPGLISSEDVQALRSKTIEDLNNRVEPFELEAEVKYPGAPLSLNAEGGQTIRRLLNAYQRDPVYENVAKHSVISHAILEILHCQRVNLNPNHHNCIMTKQPAYSSKTLWHRDTRYWNFSDKYLINAWIALGDELEENGAMMILPGSHRWEIENDALDETQFLKQDHPYNQTRLATQRLVTLKAGDVLLFSAHCFHAAGNNTTDQSKFSMVFTYHGEQTQALSGTKSSQAPEIQII